MRMFFIFLCTMFMSATYAAPTDCMQLAPDGQVKCIKATSTFKYAGGGAPLTGTFEETVSVFNEAHLSNECSLYPGQVCYIQYENNPPDPDKQPDWTVAAHFKFTHINYNTSNNGAGWIVVTHYASKGGTFGRYQMKVYHFRSCPTNTTAVNVSNDSYLRYCKPANMQFEPSSCDNGCDSNQGKSTIGN